MKCVASSVLIALAFCVRGLSAAELCPLREVRLAADGPIAAAVRADVECLRSLDCDRLLAPFRREAGLPKKSDPYGGWESIGLDGHTLGHCMSALAGMIASGNDKDGEFAWRLAYIIGELKACQEARGDGSLDGIPGSRDMWASMSKGEFGPMRGHWAPWYNVHKTMAGLRDAHEMVNIPCAKEILIRLADWAMAATSALDRDRMQEMLDQEFGGMNEVFADVAAITGDAKYLDEAKRWEHAAELGPLYAKEDRMSGRHANTMIPKIAGLARTAQLAGDERRRAAADWGWEEIVTRRSTAFGGNSVCEHFQELDDTEKLMSEAQGPETCNTYNMLRLAERLFEMKPHAKYADYCERALFNHLLSAVNPVHPGFVYYTPARPGHYRVYSNSTNCFWCCFGTGMENPPRYGRFVYARADDGGTIYVNLFTASTLKGTLRQTTSFPDDEKSQIEILADMDDVELKVRRPFWCCGFSLAVNGETVDASSGRDGYASIRRNWRRGDRVSVGLPMNWRVEMLPASRWGAIMKGPLLMGRNAGTNDLDGLFADGSGSSHTALGPKIPLHRMPWREIEKVGEVAGLVPFYSLHECRYQIYWEFGEKGDMEKLRRAAEAKESGARRREAATVDKVDPGRQQSETDHGFACAEGSEHGYHRQRHWRDGKWFAYTLDPRGCEDLSLEVEYWGGDSGRSFDVLANGEAIAHVRLDGSEGERFFTQRYRLPRNAGAVRADGRIRVAFVSTEGKAGGVFGIRLVK